jgi:two-component system phosphate regulon response regulator PhoB
VDATDLRFIPERFAVRIGDRDIVLTPTQYRLLEVLAAEPGRVFTRADLAKLALAESVSERTIDVHIKDLRRKLEPHDWRVQTIRGQGYRFLTDLPG